jgi:radical SAM enzyme (rSAM/lipoprotein system)
MPLTDFLRVLDEVKEYQHPGKVTLALTGGEPLLREDLALCGAEFVKRGYSWGTVTNGYLLTPDRFTMLLDAGLRSVTISLDGLELSHNWLRRREDSFAKALAAIERAAATTGIVYDVVTCVSQRNFGELEALKELLNDRGVKRWRLTAIFPKGRAENEPLLDLNPSQLVGLLDFIQATRREGRVRASYSCEGFLGPYEGKVRDGFFFCRAGVNIGSVLADGSISACPSLRGDYIQGTIYRDNFMREWNERFGIMRNRQWTKSGECADCGVYRWCNGNGLHLRREGSDKTLRCHYRMLQGNVTTGRA